MSELKKKIFSATKIGFFSAGRDRKMVQKATDKAEAWMRENSHYRIRDISTCLGQMGAVVVVWYEEGEKQDDFERSGI